MLALLLCGVAASAARAAPPDDDLAALAPAIPLKRLDFERGEPVVPVRLMEGSSEVTVVLDAPGRLEAQGQVVALGPGSYRVRLDGGTAAVRTARIQLEELRSGDEAQVRAAVDEWAARGVPVRTEQVGRVYGIAGKVVDTRRWAVLLDEPAAAPEALAERQAELLTRLQVRTTLLESVVTPAAASLLVLDGDGGVRLTAPTPVTLRPQGEAVEVKRVEYGLGYDFHNFEDRRYRGALVFAADQRGKVAVVNVVGLEGLLKGLVPAEIFSRAHPEALKAQAVTARGEVLAKVGLKHLADPYFLCSEQHCAVYKGLLGEVASTSAAVEATRGEALFDAEGRLVDSVYSAMCGGHTEHNEVVWGGVPSPSLRGRPDVLPDAGLPFSPSQDLRGFLASRAPVMCRTSSFSSPSRFRWERRFTGAEVDRLLLPHRVGRVYAMKPLERGVSGRVRLLSVSGEDGATTIKGELTIRRLFGNLNSALFELSAERDARGRPLAWTFVGGGWGHGVGLCQTGAIGRAEAGQTYRQILGHYFSGASVERLYGP